MVSNTRNRGFRLCIFPGYNWCGPGCSGPGAPVNDVDALCKAHDECYRRSGNRRACDEAFIRQLRPKINRQTQKGRHARTLYNFMRIKTMF
ncbi:phospholipase [Ornithinibacillus xuwenensis]|uniref:Phospholipase n=1 Tax=Ornithinibacillus xuwenensis TaxID=3144668 RepID=A0ABU9XH91_9BACI